ncbi:hypothetical protein [Duganella sp. BuS-21]|uniref:hypothetical protein n=1 Tax=Duganella sp. BuS-21 TaxID=2943848 RepID=UPI0035A59E97
MHSLGFLTLGASAGLLSGLLLPAGSARNSAALSLVALTPIVLSGTLVFLHPTLAQSPAMHFYGIGLLVALMWQGVAASISALNLPFRQQRSLALVNIVASLILTGWALRFYLQQA